MTTGEFVVIVACVVAGFWLVSFIIEAFGTKNKLADQSGNNTLQVSTGDQALHVSSQDRVLAAPSRERRRFGRYFISSVAVVALVAVGVRFLAHSTATAPKGPDQSILITGADRASFVTEGLKSCMTRQTADPESKSLSLSNEILNNYCSCLMNALADDITYGDLRNVPTGGTVPSWMQTKIDAVSPRCIDRMQRSLLGAGR
jgi:hypothetical protein